MSYTPRGYDQINLAAGTYSPSNVKILNNQAFKFWERALLQRAISVLDFSLPSEWDGAPKDFILYCLFKYGYVGIVDTKEYGLIAQPCMLNGYNVYYQPTEVIIANPLLHDDNRYKIGENAEVLKLCPDYQGIWDIIRYYAEKLALLDNAINMSIINSKFAWLVGAKTKAAAQSLKKMLDMVNKGEPAVVYDQRIVNDVASKDEPFQFIPFGDVKNNYLTTIQLQDFATIINQFDTEIGIPTVPYQKKERMVTSEAESKQIEAIARVTTWLETLQNSIDVINKHFGLNIEVKLRYEEEDNANELIENDNSINE